MIAELMIADMKKTLDPSQYANQKGVTLQHYLTRQSYESEMVWIDLH